MLAKAGLLPHSQVTGQIGKQYSNVINVKREIQFLPDNGTSYQTIFSGNSFYAKGYGLIDQVFNTTPVQSLSLYGVPVIK